MTKPAIKPLAVHVRWMIRRDMPEVLGIENANFEFAWPEDEFVRVLRNRNVIALVAEHGEKVVGFVVYELHKTRIHILNFGVHAACHRRGVGRALVDRLKDKLSKDRRNKIRCEVRETNLDAQLFFKAMGFRALRVLPDFYDEFCSEDGYLFQYRFGQEGA